MYPAFSHLWSMAFSIGMCVMSHVWLIRSKHALIAPSSTHCAELRRPRTVWHWVIASAVERPTRNP
jgi:hypothetical protein